MTTLMNMSLLTVICDKLNETNFTASGYSTTMIRKPVYMVRGVVKMRDASALLIVFNSKKNGIAVKDFCHFMSPHCRSKQV